MNATHLGDLRPQGADWGLKRGCKHAFGPNGPKSMAPEQEAREGSCRPYGPKGMAPLSHAATHVVRRRPGKAATPDRAAYFRVGQRSPISWPMAKGTSRDRIAGGRGPIVDITNVVLLRRFSEPCVEAMSTAPSNDAEPL